MKVLMRSWKIMVFKYLLWCCMIIYGAKAGIFSNPTCAPGRHTITHLFEWKWLDIKAECEKFLGPYGYCGVQISPPSENAVVTSPNRPWWERYQPVSYKLTTRSGNEEEFQDMVNTCNQHNVRIFVDAVINHMTGAWTGNGTAGNPFDGINCEYPSVPYSPDHCHGRLECPTSDGNIHNYGNPIEVRNCRLVTLADLKLGNEYVRSKVAEYLNNLIDIGVAGFRVDAAKHMRPDDLRSIFGHLHDLRQDVFGSGVKPFIFHEVIDMGGEPIRMSEYFDTGRVTNFMYGKKLAEIFLHRRDQAKWLDSWGEGWGMPSRYDVLVFLNNHDNQRGHGAGGSVITFFNPKEMKIATAFMLAHPYGFPRVMSSYTWQRDFQQGKDRNDWVGPPHDENMNIKSVQINPDMSCGGGWVCEHRWRQVYNMVAYRNVVAGTDINNWWSKGDYQIAFSRGHKGFIVINAEKSKVLSADIYTGLPTGSYCDVISGSYINERCTGDIVHVDSDGNARFSIDAASDDPVVAIHIGAKFGSPKKVTT